MASKTKTENRYSGTDTTPWIVVGVDGKPLLTSDKGGARDYPGYSQAATAARQYTENAHEPAFARRS